MTSGVYLASGRLPGRGKNSFTATRSSDGEPNVESGD
jgi:hypothetical protein